MSSATILIDIEDVLDQAESQELINELKERGDYEGQDTASKIQENNPSVNGSVDDEIISRFTKCHHLLKWEQWNHIFCQIEKMSKEERASQPEKFNYI